MIFLAAVNYAYYVSVFPVVRTRMLPGYGVFVTSGTEEEKMLPGYGVVGNAAIETGGQPPPGPLNANRMASMHLQRHYEPIGMGV